MRHSPQAAVQPARGVVPAVPERVGGGRGDSVPPGGAGRDRPPGGAFSFPHSTSRLARSLARSRSSSHPASGAGSMIRDRDADGGTAALLRGPNTPQSGYRLPQVRHGPQGETREDRGRGCVLEHEPERDVRQGAPPAASAPRFRSGLHEFPFSGASSTKHQLSLLVCPPPAAFSSQHALHGGCPVKKGTKWVMTRWIRDKGFGRIA